MDKGYEIIKKVCFYKGNFIFNKGGQPYIFRWIKKWRICVKVEEKEKVKKIKLYKYTKKYYKY